MGTDLNTRLHLYAASDSADAISCWRAATAGHSAGIICSHTRVLRDSEDDPDTEKPRPRLPLQPGNNSVELLAQGAEGVIILKGRNG